jgi:hypothetical protein
MQYASTTTLERIRGASPCPEGWTELLANLGKTKADDEPLPLLTVLDSNGLDDALWVLSYAMPDDRLARHFQAWCAEQVLHIFEAARPGDTRVHEQIAMLRNDDATPEERVAARAAAGAAAGAAALYAARAAARAAAGAVAWAAAGEAGDAAWAAAGAVAWAAVTNAQEKQLRLMMEETA